MKNILYIGNKLSKYGYTPTNIETLGPLLENEGYTIYYSSDRHNQFSRLCDMLTSIACSKATGVVLIDTYSTKAFYFSWICAQLCRLLCIKYIPILHGGNMPNRLSKHPVLSRQLFKYSYTNIVISGYLKKHLDESGFRNQLIPNNIDLGFYPFKLRKNVKPAILWVRSFDEIYNPQLAIKLLKQITGKHPDAYLTMVGPDKDGSLQRCKRLSEELSIIDKVTFTGKLTKQEWITLSLEHDIFLNTTNFDNLPVSVIEAMALGMLVVSTDVGGIPYLVTDQQNGLLVPKGDLEALEKGIERLMNDDNLANRLSNSARITASAFDWPVVRHQWNSLLKPLISEY